jgi:hypothetical protein
VGVTGRFRVVSFGSWQSRAMRFATWLAGGVWIGSWYLMYLEITRWHHVKPSLAFNSDHDTVTGSRPRPGRPLILLYIASVAAPLVVGFQMITHIRTRRNAS